MLDLHVRDIGGTSASTLVESPHPKSISHWTADGQYIVYVSSHPTTMEDLWVLPLFGDRTPVPFLATQSNELQGEVSPDGRWIAYTSDESGAWEVYVPQASIRYEFEKGTKWRVEAGKFTSPIGLGMTENRASVNDGVIWWHRGYYSYLPPIGGGAAPHALIASIYPMGVQANTSAKHWDARVAFIDRAPTDFFHQEGAPARGNAVA